MIILIILWSSWSSWSSCDNLVIILIILWSSWSFVDPQMRFMDIEDELKVVGQNQQTLEVDFLFIKWLGWYDGRWEPIFIIKNKWWGPIFLWWGPILSDRINNLEIFLDFQLISFLSGSKSIFLFDWTFEELKKAPFHLFNDVWKIWKDFFYFKRWARKKALNVRSSCRNKSRWDGGLRSRHHCQKNCYCCLKTHYDHFILIILIIFV